MKRPEVRREALDVDGILQDLAHAKSFRGALVGRELARAIAARTISLGDLNMLDVAAKTRQGELTPTGSGMSRPDSEPLVVLAIEEPWTPSDNLQLEVSAFSQFSSIEQSLPANDRD
jgi:hypothetical protein